LGEKKKKKWLAKKLLSFSFLSLFASLPPSSKAQKLSLFFISLFPLSFSSDVFQTWGTASYKAPEIRNCHIVFAGRSCQ
jgi:hypothetical protein